MPALPADESRCNRQGSRHYAEQFLFLAQCALFRRRSFRQSIEEYKERRLQPLSISSFYAPEPHPEERAFARVSKDGPQRGLVVRDAAQDARLLTMRKILLRRPWIDRRRAAQAQNVLQQPGASEKLGLAARRRHHLQSDRQARRGESARQRQRGTANQRNRIDDAEPLDVVVEFLARTFGDIA